jgi:chromosomal replication initiator protein
LSDLLSTELTAPEIWELILEESQKVINPQTYRTWFEPTEAVTLTQDQLVVNVKNQFAVDYIEGQYGGVLSNIADRLFENELAVVFQSDSEESPRPLAARAVTPAEPPTSGPPESRGTTMTVGLPLNPRYTFNTFVVGDSNQWAHAASLAVAETPASAYNPLFIYGGVGLGKTHLMQAIGNTAAATDRLETVCYLSAETFMNQMVEALQFGKTLEFRNKYRRMDLLLIDDVQFLQGKDATISRSSSPATAHPRKFPPSRSGSYHVSNGVSSSTFNLRISRPASPFSSTRLNETTFTSRKMSSSSSQRTSSQMCVSSRDLSSD